MKAAYANTVNGQIANRTVRYGVLLEQYKTAEVRKLVGFLNREVEPDLVKQLQKYAGKELTRTRLRGLQQAIQSITKDGYVSLRDQLRGDLVDQASVDAAAGAKIIREALPFHFSMYMPSAASLRSIVSGTPIHGRFVPEWFAELGQATIRKVNQQLLIGATEGEGIDAIVRRIVGTRANQYRDGILERSRSDVAAVVRTAVAGVSKNAREAMYRANDDLVKGAQWVATLSAKTCEICMDRDGDVYDLDEVPDLPHYCCLCTTVPVVASWQEMGLPLQEVPTERASNVLTQAEYNRLSKLDPDERRAMKAQLQGQVADRVFYPEWLRQQSNEVQAEALGVRKAELFRSGDLEISQFVGRNDRILTLDELEDEL